MYNSTQLHFQHTNIYLQNMHIVICCSMHIWLSFSRVSHTRRFPFVAVPLQQQCPCCSAWPSALKRFSQWSSEHEDANGTFKGGEAQGVTRFPRSLLHGQSSLSPEQGAQHLCLATQEEAAFSMTVLPLNNSWPSTWPYQFNGSPSQTALQ